MKYDDNFEKIIEYLFESEKGYVNHKRDRGCPTNLGVTQTTYDDWREQKGLPKQDVKILPKMRLNNCITRNFGKVQAPLRLKI